MRRVEDLPQKVIARRLGIAEATVEKHLVRGIRSLADSLYGPERTQDGTPDKYDAEVEPNHGK